MICAGWGIAEIARRLLAQRYHFQPRAGGHYQHFKRWPVETAIRAAVSVEQGRNLIFENQRQYR